MTFTTADYYKATGTHVTASLSTVVTVYLNNVFHQESFCLYCTGKQYSICYELINFKAGDSMKVTCFRLEKKPQVHLFRGGDCNSRNSLCLSFLKIWRIRICDVVDLSVNWLNSLRLANDRHLQWNIYAGCSFKDLHICCWKIHTIFSRKYYLKFNQSSVHKLLKFKAGKVYFSERGCL